MFFKRKDSLVFRKGSSFPNNTILILPVQHLETMKEAQSVLGTVSQILIQISIFNL